MYVGWPDMRTHQECWPLMKRHSRLNEAKQNISKVIPCLKMTIILLHISLFLDHTYVHNMKIHICQQISFSTTQALKNSNCPYLYFRSYWNDGRFSPNRKMYKPSQISSILWDFVGNSFNGIFAKRVILHMIFIGKIWTNLTNAIMSKYFYFHTYCYLAWRSIWCNT